MHVEAKFNLFLDWGPLLDYSSTISFSNQGLNVNSSNLKSSWKIHLAQSFGKKKKKRTKKTPLWSDFTAASSCDPALTLLLDKKYAGRHIQVPSIMFLLYFFLLFSSLPSKKITRLVCQPHFFFIF